MAARKKAESPKDIRNIAEQQEKAQIFCDQLIRRLEEMGFYLSASGKIFNGDMIVEKLIPKVSD